MKDLIPLIVLMLVVVVCSVYFLYTVEHTGYCKYEDWEHRNFNSTQCYSYAKMRWPFDKEMKCRHEAYLGKIDCHGTQVCVMAPELASCRNSEAISGSVKR